MNEQKTGSLSGKVALLTGGGSGLGLAIVRRYIEEDARVGILERSAELCTQLEHRFGVAVSVTHGDVRFADTKMPCCMSRTCKPHMAKAWCFSIFP